MTNEIMNEIKSCVEKEFGPGYKVEIRDIEKNNGVVYKAVLVRESENNVCPTIYIDELLCKLEKGLATVDDVVEYIVSMRKRCGTNKYTSIVNELSKDTILDNVIYQVINKEKNIYGINDKPHKEFLDLVAIYRYMVPNDSENASIVITRRICEAYGISEAELDKAAEKNTREKQNFRIVGISQMIGEHDGTQGYDDEDYMYVLTSENLVFGASILLYEEYFAELSNRIHSDLFVLPSSINDVIAVPAFGESVWFLKEMVRDVNEADVKDEEILGNNVYRYSRKERKLTIVEE